MGFGGIEEVPESVMMPEFIHAPFIEKSKADIAVRALELGVPLHMTWSCYKGGENHCGRCGTCVERLEAIDEALSIMCTVDNELHRKAGVCDYVDNTVYDDTEFWKVAVDEAVSRPAQG